MLTEFRGFFDFSRRFEQDAQCFVVSAVGQDCRAENSHGDRMQARNAETVGNVEKVGADFNGFFCLTDVDQGERRVEALSRGGA